MSSPATSTAFVSWIQCYTSSAWTNGHIMTLWMQHVFSRRTTAAKPCLLIMDNASFHKDESCITELKQQGGRADFLPPNTTCRLQPLDHSINGLLKTFVRDEWTTWMRRPHPSVTKGGKLKVASKTELLGWIRTAWNRIKPENIVKSFSHCFLIDRQLPKVPKSRLRRRRNSL